MVKIIDTYHLINDLFDDGNINLERWENYINSIYSDSAQTFREDMQFYYNQGYTFEEHFLPIINNVYHNPNLDLLHQNFIALTKNINQKIQNQFNKEIHVDLVLYLGLCNSAGWVTKMNDTDTILLGVEKILELKWYDYDSMIGLIYHELGHSYHNEYGKFNQSTDDTQKSFIYQLFYEGIAMVFEQILINDFNYYHQKKDWINWCNEHFNQILYDFNADLLTITHFNQRYFGDMCDYHGYGDVGYYLGSKFVQSLLNQYTIDELINLDIDAVTELYKQFYQSYN